MMQIELGALQARLEFKIIESSSKWILCLE